ncbi:exonuclease domain-containing protein [Streptomyces sp. NBC_01012]|uniref:exonuclease domain-containing protein n=1 Tax=Streptomyces sp. NBC_01012 TaxID=2903717 RepID=UPI00386551C5|nr:3'-5' exonuclease [Streptomyces sp. NBC_01012]
MIHWFDGPLAAFDIGTTGPDAEEDRIVSAALVVQDTTGGRIRVTRWLVSPGIPVPPGATGIHGLTDDHLQRNGRWPAPVVEEIARALAEQSATGRPLAVMNAPFGLTLLDRELRRHRASSLAGCLRDQPLHVLDPRVLDKHLDRYRKGPRTPADLCEVYGVTPDGGHDAAAGAAASLELVRAVGRRFAARLERLSAAEVHALQAVWHADQARGLQAWFEKSDTPGPVDPAWPLRPKLPAAA